VISKANLIRKVQELALLVLFFNLSLNQISQVWI